MHAEERRSAVASSRIRDEPHDPPRHGRDVKHGTTHLATVGFMRGKDGLETGGVPAILRQVRSASG
jgi:hypothetical protein